MLNKNDNVIITSDCQTKGYKGIVNKIFYCGDKLCASIRLSETPPSGMKFQSYNIDSLKLIDKQCDNCTEEVKCEMINGYYIVEVKGSYSNKYSYKCRFDVNIGDKVVCEDENYIQRVTGVYNIETASIKYPTKEVICVVDYSKVNARKERERLITQTKRELDAKVRLIQSKIDYEFYASKDIEIVELLKKMNELKGEK